MIVEGEKWHLPIPFRAVPKPKITWHKDGKELKDDERMSFRQEYLSCHLEIESCLHADSGQYKVTLENSLGASSGTINVKVVGTFQCQILLYYYTIIFHGVPNSVIITFYIFDPENI